MRRNMKYVFQAMIFGIRRVPLLCVFLAFDANLNALLLGLHPLFNKVYSNAEAFPPVIALANRAFPHECAVWFGPTT